MIRARLTALFLSLIASVALFAIFSGETKHASASASTAARPVSVCLQYCGSPPFQYCCYVQPTPSAGFTIELSNYALQDNEIMFCNNATGWCEKTALGAGGFFNGGVGTDFGSAGGWPIDHVQSRLHKASTLYSNGNFTGTIQSIPAGYNGGDNFRPNSFALQN